MKRAGVLLLAACAAGLLACKEDPYGLFPTTLKIEEYVGGPYELREGEAPPGRKVVTVLRGRYYENGGIVYRPIEIPKVTAPSRSFADALLNRKSRAGEVFDLLAQGFVGEGYDGTLVPRAELGPRGRALVEVENRDRATLVEEVRREAGLPPEASSAVARAFAIARQYYLPEGFAYERSPGDWRVSTGSRKFFYSGRGRDASPTAAEAPSSASAEAPRLVGAPLPTPR